MEISREEYMGLQRRIFDLTVQLQHIEIEAEVNAINKLTYAKDEMQNKLIQRATTAEKERDDYKERFEKLMKLNEEVLTSNRDITEKAYKLAIDYTELKKTINGSIEK